MTRYFRIMAGARSIYAAKCLSDGFIGGDWMSDQDLNGHLSENLKTFNTWFIPKFLELNPDKSKISAGLAGGMLWTICKTLK